MKSDINTVSVKLTRASVLAIDKHGQVGETVSVSPKLARELVNNGRATVVEEEPAKAESPAKEPEPAKEETADPEPEKRGPGRPRKP